MDIFWYTSENTMVIIQQKKGSVCSTPGVVTEEGERILNTGLNNGGTIRQRSLHTIEKHGSNQHAIKVNLSLIL